MIHDMIKHNTTWHSKHFAWKESWHRHNHTGISQHFMAFHGISWHFMALHGTSWHDMHDHDHLIHVMHCMKPSCLVLQVKYKWWTSTSSDPCFLAREFLAVGMPMLALLHRNSVAFGLVRGRAAVALHAWEGCPGHWKFWPMIQMWRTNM